jgi:hypothetical protein
VYLETATEANVAYYSRAGHEVLGELKPLGVRIWLMMRLSAAAVQENCFPILKPQSGFPRVALEGVLVDV